MGGQEVLDIRHNVTKMKLKHDLTDRSFFFVFVRRPDIRFA